MFSRYFSTQEAAFISLIGKSSLRWIDNWIKQANNTCFLCLNNSLYAFVFYIHNTLNIRSNHYKYIYEVL
jgi:hypothetical protein